MRRLLSGTLRLGGVLTSVVLLVACSPGPVEVASPPAGQGSAACDGLVADLPHVILEQGRRDVEPADAAAAAWGEPPIVLRCGVDKPAALRRTSPCAVVNDIGWLVTRDGVALDLASQTVGDLTFTTIGRSVYVEVTVPASSAPAGAVLVEVSTAIKDNTAEGQPCE